MQIFIDRREVRELPEGVMPGDVVQACISQVRERGRLVVAIEADGAQVMDPARLSGAREVHLTTADPREMLAEAAEAATTMLDECASLQNSAADAMMEGRIDEGSGAMQRVMECWGRVHRATVQIDQFESSLRDGRADAAPTGVVVLSDDLAALLKNLKGAIVTEDWSAAADVLGVDLLRLCARWRTHLGCRSGAINNAPG